MQFDEYASDYDAALEKGISVSGESKDYFARTRVAWLSGCLKELGSVPRRIMDYGCGTGSAASYLLELSSTVSILGVDVSDKSLDVARKTFSPDRTRFLLFDEFQPKEDMDLAFCNGVFHHIPPKDRPAAIRYVRHALRPGGFFAVWENNPWNPGARYVMRRIPFDRDAAPIAAPETRRLLREGGFEVVRTDFLFVFPRVLRYLRFLETAVAKLPLGAQYQVLCRKLDRHE